MVYGIVKQSGGYVWIDSHPGQGTSVSICLPRGNAEPAPAPRDAATNARVRPSETILLAEDEPTVRDLVRGYLRGAGYEVLEASDGAAALSLESRHPGTIHLLLTDIVMPGISGVELAARMRVRRAGVKVLYMSGYTEEAMESVGLESTAAFIAKPYSQSELLARIRRALDG
jgi:CheY-like chemotaxis protein